MKTVTLAEIQANLPALIRVVESGAEIRVVQNRRIVAKIVPAVRQSKRKVDWSGTWTKVDEIFDRKLVKGEPGSQIIIESRR